MSNVSKIGFSSGAAGAVIKVGDGKYTVLHENGLNLRALRHGEPWMRDFIGDKLVLAMAQDIERLQEVAASHIELLKVLQVHFYFSSDHAKAITAAIQDFESQAL